MRRVLVIVCLACLGVLSVPHPTQARQEAAPRPQNVQTLSVVFMRSPGDPATLNDYLAQQEAAFEAANPQIDIVTTWVDWASGRETLLGLVEDGNPPDLAVIGSRWVPEFVSLGLIEPLDGYLSRDFRRLFIPTVIEGATYQGRIFGLPIGTSTRAMFYNRDILAQAGWDEPPQTWDELLTAGQAINAMNEDVYGFGLQGGGGVETNTYFYYFVWGNGGDLYNASRTASALNAPEAVEALAFVQRLINENATQPDPASDTYARRLSVESLFVQGRLGMVISGPWLVRFINNIAPDLNYGVAPIPYNTTPVTYGVIDTIVMFSTSERKEMAWSYLEFLYSSDARLEYAELTGILPELLSVAADPAFAEHPYYSVFLNQLPNARFEPLHIQSEQISQTVIDAIRAVYQGEAEPQTALDEAATRINSLLETSVVGW